MYKTDSRRFGVKYFVSCTMPEYKNEEGGDNSDDLGNATQENYED